ncbi:MAG: 4a-hydroxytetrahydrobiopterin dehydratase [Planctomycetota bacterium]|nr:MAG: 4a-hydroxytetrahydrobiopterin dehydratase [Planctomycetota bacterium]
MAQDVVLSEEEIQRALAELPGWEVRDGWLRRKYVTPGWPHTLLLAQAIGFLAEAAWHHPDLELGYAQVIVKLHPPPARGITASDVELAQRIEQLAMWKPEEGSPLQGFPKNWIR